MEEIKRRHLVVHQFLNGELTTGYKMTNIETIYLQLRKTSNLLRSLRSSRTSRNTRDSRRNSHSIGMLPEFSTT
jgi:hypothetical protein